MQTFAIFDYSGYSFEFMTNLFNKSCVFNVVDTMKYEKFINLIIYFSE